MADVYNRLAKRLDSLPNGFPATESGVELKILRKIFSPEEAEMVLNVRTVPETAPAISERLAIPLEEMQSLLDTMVEKGQIGSGKARTGRVYMLFPFCFGIYEFQLSRVDRELALLMEEYIPALVGTIGRHTPAMMRVIPLNIDIAAEHTIYPYEDFHKILQESKSFLNRPGTRTWPSDPVIGQTLMTCLLQQSITKSLEPDSEAPSLPPGGIG